MTTLLRQFHAQPGQTPIWLEPWRTHDERTSYQVMLDEIAPLSRESRLLDLACGDGYLLSLLAQTGLRSFVGVDQSPEELGRARERLGPGATLHCQQVPPLPLPDADVDVTVCHMALMLLGPLEPILAEVARVIRPGGHFVAIVNRYVVDPVNEAWRKGVHFTTVEAGLQRVRIGDARAYSTEGLTELVCAQGFDGDSLRFRDLDLHIRTAPSALWDSLRRMYDVFQLPEEAQAKAERRVLRLWEPHVDGNGLLSSTMGIRVMHCRKPALSP